MLLLRLRSSTRLFKRRLRTYMRLDHADCLDFLATIPDESVKLIIADPPYFRTIKEYWDNQWLSEQHYLAWCDKWVAESVRVLAPGGCLYVWGTTKTDTLLRLKVKCAEQDMKT